MGSPAEVGNQEMAQAGVGAPEAIPVEERPAASLRLLIEGVGNEREGAKNQVYLVTVSRVLHATQQDAGYQDVTQWSREAVGNAVRDALDHPVQTLRGIGLASAVVGSLGVRCSEGGCSCFNEPARALRLVGCRWAWPGRL